MGVATGIQWCDHTANFWRGCTKVSPACVHCYAADLVTTRMEEGWGRGAPRTRGKTVWNDVLAWDRAAYKERIRRRVFALSLGDIGDTEVPDDWRDEVMIHIWKTEWLDFMLLTKRAEAFTNYLYRLSTMDGQMYLRSRIWAGFTVEDQKSANERMPYMERLSKCVPVTWLSMEPLLGPVRLDLTHVDFIILGGESNLQGKIPQANVRQTDLAWIRELKNQARQQNCAVFIKQLGTFPVTTQPVDDDETDLIATLQGRGKNAVMVDWPKDLRLRESPTPRWQPKMKNPQQSELL